MTTDSDSQLHDALLDRLHPSLRESFVALPPAGIPLSSEQLSALFGGATQAVLHDFVRIGLSSRQEQETGIA